MGQIKSVPMTIEQCCENMNGGFETELMRDILLMFADRGCACLVSAVNPDRIYCYIKKSKEALIINKTTYSDRLADGGFSIQMRITAKKSYEMLDALSENVRGCVINGKNCKAPNCCNCGHEYRFEHNGASYAKCHMLCDNYMLHDLSPADRSSVLLLIENEFATSRAKSR